MTQHKLTPAEERRAKTNSSFRGGYLAVVNYLPRTRSRRARPVQGRRSELVTTEVAARREAEALKAKSMFFANGERAEVKDAGYFRVDPLGNVDMTFDFVEV